MGHKSTAVKHARPWRWMHPGEIRRKGDQYRSGKHWFPVAVCLGLQIPPTSAAHDFRTRRPKPPSFR